jgi:hypothetical protein
MVKQKKPDLQVRMERLPNRRAVERVREVYQQLRQLANEKPNQEAEDERISGDLRARVDPATGAGSDD